MFQNNKALFVNI